MRKLATLLAGISVALGGVAQAAERSSIPSEGSPLSYLNNILDIHETRTSTEVVRVYRVAKGTGTALVLQVRAENRPPNTEKGTQSSAWTLGSSLEEVEAVIVADNRVTIRGSDASQKQLTCTAEFRFDDGVLGKQLNDKGCHE